MATTITFLCPSGHSLTVDVRMSGTRAACPRCGMEVLVPVVQETGRPAQDAMPLAESTTRAGGGSTIRSSAAQWAADADPIDEAPEAVWYVRPPSGGQFGPASGLIMRAWIREGRVPGEALVWRAGWPQWQSAAAVFHRQGIELSAPAPVEETDEEPIEFDMDHRAEVFGGPPPGPAGAARAPTVEKLDPISRTHFQRQQSRQAAMIATGVLTVIAIVLAAVVMSVLK